MRGADVEEVLKRFHDKRERERKKEANKREKETKKNTSHLVIKRDQHARTRPEAYLARFGLGLGHPAMGVYVGE